MASDAEKKGFCQTIKDRAARFFQFYLAKRSVLILAILLIALILTCALQAIILNTGWNGWLLYVGFVIAVPLFSLPSYLLPQGTVTITVKKERAVTNLTLIVDGRRIPLKGEKGGSEEGKIMLPQQVQMYFWRRGIYPVLVVCELNVFKGDLNLFEDRTGSVTIEVEQPET